MMLFKLGRLLLLPADYQADRSVAHIINFLIIFLMLPKKNEGCVRKLYVIKNLPKKFHLGFFKYPFIFRVNRFKFEASRGQSLYFPLQVTYGVCCLL